MTTTIKTCDNKGWLGDTRNIAFQSNCHSFFLERYLLEDIMKECFKCNIIKPLSDFYKHSRMGDGHLNKCKECTKKDVRKNYKDNRPHYIEYERSRSHLPHRVESRGYSSSGKIGLYCTIPKEHPAYISETSSQSWVKRNPKKRSASSEAYKAILRGDLTKQPCEVCGTEENIHAHHCDYDRPLDVMWLCQKHHIEWHKKHGQML